eukprot:8062679-Pyramimonas_sp.AAC.1
MPTPGQTTPPPAQRSPPTPAGVNAAPGTPMGQPKPAMASPKAPSKCGRMSCSPTSPVETGDAEGKSSQPTPVIHRPQCSQPTQPWAPMTT